MPPTLPNRQSIRKHGWNYAGAGWYFVTINTHGGRALFGAIVNGRMVLNEAGRVAEEEWHKSAVVRKGIALDEFVVMPNHVHGIVRFADGRLLMISPFSDDIDAPSLRRAAWCNHYVLAHCDRLVVGHRVIVYVIPSSPASRLVYPFGSVRFL